MKTWAQEEIEFIKKWYPHFGKHWVAKELKQNYRRVKSKVDKLGILMFPKHERLCVQCKINFQKIELPDISVWNVLKKEENY